MIRLFAFTLAAIFAVSLASPPPADAQERGMRAKKERKVARHAARPVSGNGNGTCMRDSGKPDDKLDFRRRCDVEEFWNRINERASSSSPM